MKLNQVGKLLQNKLVLAALLMVLVAGTAMAGGLAWKRGQSQEPSQETAPGYAFQTQEDLGQELLQNSQEPPQGLVEIKDIQKEDPAQKEPIRETLEASHPTKEQARPVQSAKVDPLEAEVVTAEAMETVEQPWEREDTLAAEETLVAAEDAVVYEPQMDAPEVMAPVLTFGPESTMAWPVHGNVILDYSMDATTYFSTLKQYKCNPGLLIQAEVGQDVEAAVPGQVLSLEWNEELGNYIVMDLGGEYTMIYGQLEEIQVEPGEMVEAGQTLAMVAAPTKYYVVEGPHVYVELRYQESAVDPLEYIR